MQRQCSLGDLPKATVQFVRCAAVGILTSDRAPCRFVAGTPPGSDVRSRLGVRFTFRTPYLLFPLATFLEAGSQSQRPRCIDEAEARVEVEAPRVRNCDRSRHAPGSQPDVPPHRRQAQRYVHSRPVATASDR